VKISFALWLALATSFADVPPKAPALSPAEAAKTERVRKEAEENYRRGLQLAEGDGVAKNYAAAANFYRKAAEAGHVAAQYDLAYLYENGLGVTRDCKQAAYWYRKAAEQGDPEAQNNLGALYAIGDGVPQSDAEAVHWYLFAARQGDPEATCNLGTMYLQGRGVAMDFVQAFQLFRKGYAVAQNNLALMYANGQAVAKDYMWAYAWLDLAATQISGCGELRDRIAQEMTAEEIARARILSEKKREELAQKAKDSK
jgi:TPR repeat protein